MRRKAAPEISSARFNVSRYLQPGGSESLDSLCGNSGLCVPRVVLCWIPRQVALSQGRLGTCCSGSSLVIGEASMVKHTAISRAEKAGAPRVLSGASQELAKAPRSAPLGAVEALARVARGERN